MSHSILAKKYVIALKKAIERHDLELTFKETIDYINKIIENTPLSNLLLNPISHSNLKEKEIKQITQNSKSTNKMTEKFFLLLLRKKRLALISEIKQELMNELNNIQNKIEVKIITAKETPHSEIEKILTTVKTITPKNIKAELYEDRKILGGFKLIMDHTIYDATINNTLNKLQETLISR